MNQNWICKNIRNSDICLQKFGCFVWRIIFECNSLSFVNRNVRKSWKFRQITFCKNTVLQIHEFCKRSLEKAAYLVGILGQQSILKNHTRGHFLFHKNIKDFAKTHEISYLLSNHWKFSFFERHVFSSKLQFQGCKFTLFSKHCNFFCQNGVFMLNCVVIVYMLQPEIAFFS